MVLTSHDQRSRISCCIGWLLPSTVQACITLFFDLTYCRLWYMSILSHELEIHPGPQQPPSGIWVLWSSHSTTSWHAPSWLLVSNWIWSQWWNDFKDLVLIISSWRMLFTHNCKHFACHWQTHILVWCLWGHRRYSYWLASMHLRNFVNNHKLIEW